MEDEIALLSDVMNCLRPINLILLRNSQIFVVVAYFPLAFVLQIKFLESFDFRLSVQMTSKWNAN